MEKKNSSVAAIVAEIICSAEAVERVRRGAKAGITRHVKAVGNDLPERWEELLEKFLPQKGGSERLAFGLHVPFGGDLLDLPEDLGKEFGRPGTAYELLSLWSAGRIPKGTQCVIAQVPCHSLVLGGSYKPGEDSYVVAVYPGFGVMFAKSYALPSKGIQILGVRRT